MRTMRIRVLESIDGLTIDDLAHITGLDMHCVSENDPQPIVEITLGDNSEEIVVEKLIALDVNVEVVSLPTPPEKLDFVEERFILNRSVYYD